MSNETRNAEGFLNKETPAANDLVVFWDSTLKKMARFSFAKLLLYLANYFYNKDQVDELFKNAGGDRFESNFTVNTGGLPFLKWADGSEVPAEGKTAAELMLEGSRRSVAAVYYFPSAALAGSLSLDSREVGETINLTLDAGFTQNDGGAALGVSIKKDNVEFATSEPVTYLALVFSKVAQTFLASYAYGAGPVKADNLGDPSPYANGAGLPAGSVSSNVLTALGYYKIWFGPCAVVPADGAAARALPQSQLENAGNTFILNTGTADVNFALILPPGKSLNEVKDLDALNAVVTSEYALVDNSFTGKDAAGADVPGCKKYVKTQAVPYASNHRHQITIS